MDRQPVLTGERLQLRPLERADFDALFAVASDPLIWQQHPMHDRWQENVFRVFFEDALEHGGALAVISSASGAVIGSSRFQAHEAADGGSVEIGWTFLSRANWGDGSNAEMKRLMLRHAFQSVARVVFRVGETNWRSRKAMEKIGGKLTDKVERVQLNEEEFIHLVYEITRDNFAAGPLA